MLLLYAVLFGVLVGLATHGSLTRLADARVRLWPLALLGLAFQVVLFSSPIADVVGSWGPVLYVLSTAVVLGALLVNVRQPGFWLILLGAALNFAVIVANGGQMPASPAALALLTGQPVVPTDAFSNSVLAGPHTIFPSLGDVYVLPQPIPFANVFSIGDVLIGLGGAVWLVRVMQGGGREAQSRRQMGSVAGIQHANG